jgi:hypothetical protein
MRHLVLFFVSYLSLTNAFSQGCSDAGFCTVDGIKTQESGITDSAEIFKNTTKFGLSFGSTRYNVVILTPYAEYSRSLGANFDFSLRLLATARFGDFTTTFDLSDVVFTGNFKLTKQIKLIGGTKIPFNNADKSYKGTPLPMAYQSSLGTFDAIAGVSFASSKWLFVFALQYPLNHNDNEYFEDQPLEPSLEKYVSTNKYKRRGDVLLRISYLQKPVGKNKKWQFVYSILPVYHLQNDTYEDLDGNKQTLIDSKGLTLNLNIFANYKLSKSSFIEFTLGAPLLARKVRPDGLPQFAIGTEFIKKF